MLAGIKVVELATYIAAPGAAGILADWGAEVIKVEPLAGCPMRYTMANMGADHLQGSPIFDLDNRGKKGIAINTATPEGVEAVKRLVKDADIFITNVRPGGLERSGLDYKSLSAINPRLVYASVTGYGLEGPDRDRPGFDVAAFYARSGVGYLQTVKGREPTILRTGIGDHTTSMATVGGILAAIVERQTTGKGRLVEASLLRTGIYAAGSDTAVQLKYGKLGSTKSRHESVAPLSNFFKAKGDEWFVIVPRQGSVDWKAVCRVIGKPELETDERFNNPKVRRTNAALLVDILDAAFGEHDIAHWSKSLDAEDMIWAPLMKPGDVAKDPQAIAAGAFVEVPEHDGNGTYLSPASPIRFPGANDGPKGPAPALGEHTLAVLHDLGYSDADIEKLKAAKAIA
ncbi:MAG: CoA transferase [Parvibaculum sp.]|uniref:CaiB/BaiF CoA transferase family protein n=1 Tax=Parvibaculum sp. TaxID=2024848 RepID=UPI0025E7280E|nr:CaiB/BaiF CoA-transferase family protein [Parvibaculum sp.]MCE9649531.1 CoA transferase [Parvibaculum sp.]